MTLIAWLLAVGGGFMACVLVIAENWGIQFPAPWPLKVHMWGRFVLMHLAGVIWLIFTDM